MNTFIRDGAPRPRKRRAESKVVDRSRVKKKRRTDYGRRGSLLSSSSGRGENAELIVSHPVRRHTNSDLCERRQRERHDVDRGRYDDAATSGKEDEDDDVVLVEPTWPMIDLTVAEDEDGAFGHDVADENSADQQPSVVPTECEDDSSYPADFIQLIQTVLDDFEKIDDICVNNELKHFLQTDKNKKKQHLIKMLKQCYKESEGSLNKCMQMIQQLETKAYLLVVNEESFNEKKLSTNEEILNFRIRKHYLKLFGEEHLESDYKILSQLPIIGFSDQSNIIDVDSISVDSEILEDKNIIDLDQSNDICSSTKNSFGLTIRPKVTDGRTVVAHPTKCDNTSTNSYFRNRLSTKTSTKLSYLKELNEQEKHISDTEVTVDRSVVAHSIPNDNTSIQSNSLCKNELSTNTSTKWSKLKEANIKKKQRKHKSSSKVTDSASVNIHSIRSDNTFIQSNSLCKNKLSTNMSKKWSQFRKANTKKKQRKHKSNFKVTDDRSAVAHSITNYNTSIQSNSQCKNGLSTNMSKKWSQFKIAYAKEKEEKHKSDIKVTDDRSVVTHSITNDNTSIQSNSHCKNELSSNTSTKWSQLKEVNTKETKEIHINDTGVTDDRSVVALSIPSENTSMQSNSHCKNQLSTNTSSNSSQLNEVKTNEKEEKHVSDTEVTDDRSVVTYSITSDNTSSNSSQLKEVKTNEKEEKHVSDTEVTDNRSVVTYSITSDNTSSNSSQLKKVKTKENEEKYISDTEVTDDRSVVTHSVKSNNISIQSNSYFRNESIANISSKIRHIVEVNVNKAQEESISDPDIINFIIDNNVEIVNTSDSEKLKFDQMVKKIHSKIFKIVKPNDDIFKSQIINDLALYFSSTDFVFNFDFSWRTTESKLIGELIVKLFEQFNNTKRNMAHLSGCLICIFHKIFKKSFNAPCDNKSRLILFLDCIKKFAKYYDNYFWKNWLSPKIFLDWCFVLESIFHKNSTVTNLNDESIWTNAMSYLKKIKRNEYVFKNFHTIKRKPSSGIFEFTNSDDLLDINNDFSKNISKTVTNLSSDEIVAEALPVPKHPKIAVCSEFSLSNSFKNDVCGMTINDQKSKESEPIINDLNIVQNDTLNMPSDLKDAENPNGVQKDPPVTVNDKNRPAIIINDVDGNIKKNGKKRKNNELPSKNFYYTIGNNPQKFSIASSSLPNCEQTQSCSMGIPQPLNNSNTQPANTTSIRLPNETTLQLTNVGITRVSLAKMSRPTNAMNTQLSGVTCHQLPNTKSPPSYEKSIQFSNPTNIQPSYFTNTQTSSSMSIQPLYSMNVPQTLNSMNIQPLYSTNIPQTPNAVNIQPSYSTNTPRTSNSMSIQPIYSMNIPKPPKRKKTRNVNALNMQHQNVENTQSVNNTNTQPSNTTNPQNPVEINTQFSDTNFLNSTVMSNIMNPYSTETVHAYTMNSQQMANMNTQPSSAKNSNRMNAQYSAMTNSPTTNTVNTQSSSALNSQNCNAMNSQCSAMVSPINTNIVNSQLVCALKSLVSNNLNAQYSSVINSLSKNVSNAQPQYPNATSSRSQSSTQLNAQCSATLNSQPSNGITSQPNQSIPNVQQHLIPNNGHNINTYQQYNVYNNVVNYTNVNNNANHNVISGQPITHSAANHDSTSSSQQSCCNYSCTASCYSCPSSYPADIQPPPNSTQPPVATPSSLDGIALDRNYRNPQCSNNYDPSCTSVVRHPVKTTGATNFWSPDYNSQVSPDLPNSLSPNMPNQQNYNINSKCMAPNCTDISMYSCDNCFNARYCSFKCQENDWHYHKNECRKQ